MNSRSAHADRAAVREQQVQPLNERVQQQTPEQIVDVLDVTQTGPPRSKSTIPQAQYIDKNTDVPVVYQRQELVRRPASKSHQLQCKQRILSREFGVLGDCSQETTAAGQC